MTELEKAARQALETLEGVIKAHGYKGGTPVEAVTALREALESGSQQEAHPVGRPEGIHHDATRTKCPITGRPYFMHIEHPKLGLVPTYGGPYDSYTVPILGGEPTDSWHEREMRCERYDHDQGYWVEGGEPIPLRLIHEDELFELEESTELQRHRSENGN